VSSDNTQNHDDEIKALEDKITENKTKVSRLTDLYAIGTLDVTELTNKINRLNLEIDTAQRQIDDLTATQTNKPEDIVDRVKTLGDYLDDGDTEKIRFAVRQLIDKIEIGQKKNPLERGGKDARDMIIHWNF
jgi:chromosome segregation ATPase